MGVVKICEDEAKEISCSEDEVFDITFASYGRSSIFSRCSWSTTGSCHAETSMEKVKNACQYKRSCSLIASNSIFEDPCWGVGKYLKVKYSCIPAQTTTTDVTATAEASSHHTTGAFATSSTADNGRGTLPSSAKERGLVPRLVNGTADSTNYSADEADFEVMPTPSSPLDGKVVAAIILSVFIIALLAMCIGIRRRRRRRVAGRSAESTPNELYVMEGTHQAGDGSNYVCDDENPYATINDAMQADNQQEQSFDGVYTFATDPGQPHTSDVTIQNVAYSSVPNVTNTGRDAEKPALMEGARIHSI